MSLLSLALLAQTPALAANYALLIGVSNYTHKEIKQLKGPANDVTLLWRVLEKRGFASENMTVLADGLPVGPGFPASQGDPTRAAILKGFGMLAQRAGAGDLVLIYFSGHGTEQPVADPGQDPERGNLDQVMLPIDAGTYDQASKTVRNGIVDDEIGIALDRIRDRGADVWVIIDACHAGSMTRGLVDGVVVRGVEPSALGIPSATDAIASGAPAISSKAAQGKSSQFGSRSGAGSLVEFFAVDSQFEAVERPFDEFVRPMIGADADRRMGVFTYFLYSALADSRRRIATYRELAHQIVRDMQQSQVPPPPRALPLFGGALDRPLLSIGKAPPPAAWQAKIDGNTVEVDAGALHGVTENAVLKLSASDEENAPEWARAVVQKADPIRSVARIDPPALALPPERLWARIAIPGVSFVLAVAEPPEADAPTRKLIEETKALATQQRQGAIDWVSAKANAADVRLQVHAGRVWLLPADGERVREDFQQANPRLNAYPPTPSYPMSSPDSPAKLAGALHAIARARNMVRLAEAADASRTWNEHDLEVSAQRVPAFGDNKDPHRDCRNVAQVSEQDLLKAAKSMDFRLPQPVFHCDLVRITVKNNGLRDVDVNVSYIDAASGIKYLGRDCAVMIPAGGPPLVRPLWITTWNTKANAPDSIGREHIVVTAVERRGQSQADLCFIQEAVRGVDRGQRRGTVPGKAGWLLGALEQAALASSGTRGAVSLDHDDGPDEPRAGMYLLTLQVTPTVTP